MDIVEPEAPPDRCAACGEMLDRDDSYCRVCGEDNATTEEHHEPSAEAVSDLELDRLGTWSLLKHEIIEKYSSAYTTILSKQPFVRRTLYVDGFAGAGSAYNRETNQVVDGAALRVLSVSPPFTKYHLIELNPTKAEHLAQLTQGRTNVLVHQGDCNEVILRDVLPGNHYSDYARGLCVLDPYGLTVSWQLLKELGTARSFEIIFNFMVVAANRNVLWSEPDRVSARRRQLLDRCWGDSSWQAVAYQRQGNLFGKEQSLKVTNDRFVHAYCDRLKREAGFAYVPRPIPMKNDRGATLYYLIFAGPNETGAKIVSEIFEKYRPL